MKFLSCIPVLIFFTLASFTVNNEEKVKDYLAIPGPIQFNEDAYKLSWSAHPSDYYYKQEYLPANEKAENFSNMLLVETIVASVSLEEAVRAKIKELDQRKKTDPLVNYQLSQNPATGEFLLDFIISQSLPGKPAIVEWNAYRYINLQDKSGSEGVLLFGYSKRGYGAQTTSFLANLKQNRVTDINVLSRFDIPKINF